MKKQAAAAALVGLGAFAGAGYAAKRAVMRRERRRPDPAADDNFGAPPAAVHHTFAMDDGGAVHVVEIGSGRPLVLLHGVTLTYEVWTYQLNDLADRFRVIAVDQRGHGLSTAGSDGLEVPRLAADVRAVLTALDVTDAIVVGHSMGGMVLQQFAVDFPEELRARVAGIVLLSTTSRAAPQLAAGPLLAKAVLPVTRRGLPLAARVRGELLPGGDLSYLIMRLGFGRRPSQTHVELTRSIEAAMSPHSLATLIGELFRFDVQDELAGVDVPALVVVGGADRLTPPRQARAIAEHLPGAELVVLPDAGHMLMFERRDELEKLLLGFAGRV